MRNPFICFDESENIEYLSHMCSINNVRISKVPVAGIDNSVEGMKAKDIFSAQLISEDVKLMAEKMKVDISAYSFRDLPKLLSEGLVSDDIKLRHIATVLSTKYGNRLGLILLTLRTGLPENRFARGDWSDDCWQYWADVQNLVLTGGLASGMLGKRFKEQIHYVFDVAGEKPYNISLFENSTHIGAMGCANLIEDSEKTFVVLDFGQTNIKRCVVRKRSGEIANMINLHSLPSMNMELDYSDSEDNRSCALELHRYLLNVIYDTCKKADLDPEEGRGEVIISIANYIKGSKLNPRRGGYAKLSLLSSDYAGMLSHELSSRMHRPFRVRLVHDGTAIALNFKDKEDTVCMSIGTAFGVGFPTINISKD